MVKDKVSKSMVKDKGGALIAFIIFVLIFLGFVAILMMGILVYGANLIDDTFRSIDVEIGNVSFITAYNDTLGIGISTIQNSADNYGLGLLLGMVLLMVISGFMFKEKQKVWIVAEFAILIIAFIFAVSIQRAYDLVINSSTALLDIYSVDLVNSSKFILNLPTIVPIVWAFIIILSYGLFKKREPTIGDVGF